MCNEIMTVGVIRSCHHGFSFLQEALADLIIKHRDCDVQFIRALGIGEDFS